MVSVLINIGLSSGAETGHEHLPEHSVAPDTSEIYLDGVDIQGRKEAATDIIPICTTVGPADLCFVSREQQSFNVLDMCEAQGLNDDLQTALLGCVLGSLLEKEGSPEAELCFRRTLSKLEALCDPQQTPSPENVDIGVVHLKLGWSFHRLGCLTQAVTSYSRALQLFESRCGYGHCIIVEILSHLGLARIDQGRFRDAISLFQRALNIGVEETDGMALTKANILNNLGNAFCELRHPLTAIENYNTAFELYEANGDLHGVGNTLRNLGMAYEQMGQFNVAEEMYWESLTKAGPALDVVHTLSLIADSFAARRNYQEAIEYYQICINTKRSLDDHVNVSAELSDIGHCYACMGMLDSACEACNSALTSSIRTHGLFHLEVAYIYNTIGNAYLVAQVYDSALDNFKKALGIARLSSGDRIVTEAIADIFHNIGLVYRFQARFIDAISMLTTAIRYYDCLYGRNHVKSAESVHKLGSTLRDYGCEEEAFRQLKRAERLYLDAFGDDFLEIADVLNDLGEAYVSWCRLEDAAEVLERSYNIYKKNLGEAHCLTQDAFEKLTLARGD